jgi:hypothetical protein
MRTGPVIAVILSSLRILTPPSLDAQAFSVRDSAGVRIATSQKPLWRQGVGWTIDHNPIVQIGKLDGNDAFLFTGIMDAKSIGADVVAVVDYRAHEIRLFGIDGRFIRSVGGRGQGPGEFAGAPVITFIPPDTIVAWDAANKRLSWFNTNGHLAKEVSFLATPAAAALPMAVVPDAWQLLPDGTLITTGLDLTRRTPTVQYRNVQIIGPSGQSVVEVGRFPIGEKVPVPLPQSEGRGSRSIINPFAPTSPAAARGTPVTVFVGGTASWEIKAYGPDGKLREIIRAAIPRLPVSRMLISQEKNRLKEMAEPLGVELAILQRTFDGIDFPDSTAAVSQILDDGVGQLWAARWRIRPGATPPTFDVIDSGGQWLGAVHMPPNSGEVISIAGDRVITLWRDASDVSYVRLYHVRKPDRR